MSLGDEWISASAAHAALSKVMRSSVKASRFIRSGLIDGTIRAQAAVWVEQFDVGKIPAVCPQEISNITLAIHRHPTGRVSLGGAFWRRPTSSLHDRTVLKWDLNVCAMRFVPPVKILKFKDGRAFAQVGHRMIAYDVTVSAESIGAIIARNKHLVLAFRKIKAAVDRSHPEKIRVRSDKFNWSVRLKDYYLAAEIGELFAGFPDENDAVLRKMLSDRIGDLMIDFDGGPSPKSVAKKVAELINQNLAAQRRTERA